MHDSRFVLIFNAELFEKTLFSVKKLQYYLKVWKS